MIDRYVPLWSLFGVSYQDLLEIQRENDYRTQCFNKDRIMPSLYLVRNEYSNRRVLKMP